MVRSRKMKSSKKVQKSRKQRGGQNELTFPLDEGDRMYPKDKYYNNYALLYTTKPIKIPGYKGTYIGEYYLLTNSLNPIGSPVMHGHGRFVSSEKNPENGMHTIYDGYWKNNKKDGSISFEYMNGDWGYAEFENDSLVPPNRWDIEPTYNYTDGRFYEGELILKNGIAIPANDDDVPPRTIFNFAPGPDKFLDAKGDYVELDKREAERGFRMSEHPNSRRKVPPTPANSPQPVRKVVKSSTSGIRGLKGRIHEARLTSQAPVKMNREEELREMRSLAASQSGLSVLRGFERKTALPPIQSARDTGMGHRHSRKKRKNKTKTHRKHKSRRHK